jgi:5'-3' exonuclease
MVTGMHGVGCVMVKTKNIPLSEPMGGDASCCIHSEQCKQLIESLDNDMIQFRCPFMIEVRENLEYAGRPHNSCFEEIVE